MGAKGTATIDFGNAPGGNYATVAVTGQTGIASDSKVEAWMMRTSTADHNLEEHMIAPIRLTCGNIVVGTGFTIYAVSEWRLSKTFSVSWVWD